MATSLASAADVLKSPNGKLAVELTLNAEHTPLYTVKLRGKTILPASRLGLIRDDADFSKALTLTSKSKIESVTDKYELLTAKRRHNTYRANRQVFQFETAGMKMEIVFQVSDDGVAFRYHFPEKSAEVHTLKEELSSFRFQPEAKAWLQPIAVSKSGWSATNPSYEEYYAKEIPVGTPSTLGVGWVYPALFRTGDTWVLISESALAANYCGTRLRHESPNGEYTVGFPDPRETIGTQPVNPSSTLPWLTPWRVIVVGSLKTVTESTLGIDVADKPAVTVSPAALKPGKASWSWPLLGDKKTTYDVQKQFIDYAADMGWAYCLIDAQWDKQIGYEKMAELSAYARGKNVALLLWYNSNGNWNAAPQTPKDKLLTHESRIAEFERLKAIGIKGLKVDFFGGDGQPQIAYYHALLQDSAPYGLLMNFHGATLPRGWQRTYPHLMTVEAIRGFEFVTFEQENADQQANHCAMLPFTRNVFDPMDFTPVCLDKIGKTKLVTTPAFELALSVLFTSGIQHYVDVPEGMAKMPAFVKEFMKHVPSIWDDTKFIDGYPGKLAVLARKGDDRWYVAGINGEPVEKTLTLDLSALSGSRSGSLITDGTAELFTQQAVKLPANKKLTVTLKPNGGFVLVFNP